MGLNHQMSSFSCALGEAFFLNRTLLFPDEMCFEEKHLTRWGTRASNGTDGLCMTLDRLFDVELLSSYVRLRLCKPRDGCHLGLGHHLRTGSVPARRSEKSPWSSRWTSRVLAQHRPCDRYPLVLRPLRRFGFRECIHGRIDSSLTEHVLRRSAMASDAEEIVVPLFSHADAPQDGGAVTNVMHLLRSGIFYSRRIKAAAAAIRNRLGKAYVVLHVRRADRIAPGHCLKEQCEMRDERTRPPAILRALRRFYAEQTTVYIASTEPPQFFASIGSHYRLRFAENFAQELHGFTNNYELYAVESLLGFGAAAYIETNGYAQTWFTHGCFLARQRLLAMVPPTDPTPLRVPLKEYLQSSATEVPDLADDPRITPSACDGILGAAEVTVHGVAYGTACGRNPPCGAEMNLVDSPLLHKPWKPPRCARKCAVVAGRTP